LEELQADPRFRILPTDKNRGPAILKMLKYKQAIIDEHLLYASFKKITKEEANEIINIIRTKAYELTIEGPNLPLENLYSSNAHLKRPGESPKYTAYPKFTKPQWSLDLFNPKQTVQLSSARYLLTASSNPSSNPPQATSSTLITARTPNARLFTADAISMYSNIDLNLGIASIRKWLEEEATTPQDRIKVTISLLTLVMWCNVFQLEDTFWVQLIGTAMGTSCAVTFATICFLLTERRIRTKFAHRIPFFKRFIDGILGIWLVDHSVINHEKDEEWLDFKRELNTFGRLRWKVSKLASKSVFLDLEITMGFKGQLSFRTYQKELNLHLYIPAASAHPPGTLKGTIFGNLQR
jgi:hypothetical protein